MARLLKKGLDYFTFDVSFFDDIKVRKLIRYHGAQAVVVYQLILCRIYSEGYYIRWDDDLPFIIAEAAHLQDDYVHTVILYCIQVGLFDSTLYHSDKVLTSKSIQNRFFDFCVVAKRRVPQDNPYLLVDLSSKAVQRSQKAVSTEQMQFNFEDNTIITEQMPISSEQMPISSEFGTQSKGKESKDNNSLRSSLSSSFSSSFPVCDVQEKQRKVEAGEPITASDAAVELKNNRDWLLQMQQRTGLDERAILKYLDDFVLDCDCRNKQEHSSMTDVMNHFIDWLTKKLKTDDSRKKSHGTIDGKQPSTPQQLWNMCFAELCQAVSKDVCSKTFDQLQFDRYDKGSHTLWLLVSSKDVYNCIEDSSELVGYLGSCIFKYFGKNTVIKYIISTK